MKQKLLILFLCLLTWKVFRTDWVIVCSQHNDNGAGGWSRNVCAEPKPSPLWEVPSKAEFFRDFCGENRRARPDWAFIGFKTMGPVFLFACLVLMWRLFGRGGMVWRLVREAITESKRQWS